MTVESARAVDLDRQLRQSRQYEAAALRFAAQAGVTHDDIVAEVEHFARQQAAVARQLGELEAMRVRLVDWTHELRRVAVGGGALAESVYTADEIAAAVGRVLAGRPARLITGGAA